MKIIRRAVLSALLVGVSLSLGCGNSTTSNAPTTNAKPVGEMKSGKNKNQTMPAPPPIEKVN
jgi:hypothetical protein